MEHSILFTQYSFFFFSSLIKDEAHVLIKRWLGENVPHFVLFVIITSSFSLCVDFEFVVYAVYCLHVRRHFVQLKIYFFFVQRENCKRERGRMHFLERERHTEIFRDSLTVNSTSLWHCCYLFASTYIMITFDRAILMSSRQFFSFFVHSSLKLIIIDVGIILIALIIHRIVFVVMRLWLWWNENKQNECCLLILKIHKPRTKSVSCSFIFCNWLTIDWMGERFDVFFFLFLFLFCSAIVQSISFSSRFSDHLLNGFCCNWFCIFLHRFFFQPFDIVCRLCRCWYSCCRCCFCCYVWSIFLVCIEYALINDFSRIVFVIWAKEDFQPFSEQLF